jgi:hypothetical protein
MAPLVVTSSRTYFLSLLQHHTLMIATALSKQRCQTASNRSLTLPENVGDVHEQYDNDDARVCEEAYAKIKVILGEVELLDLDAGQEWTLEEAPDGHHYVLKITMSNGEQWITRILAIMSC